MLWVLFTFPSRYWYTIGLWRVFSLGGWSRRIHTGFHVPRATQDPAGLHDASCKGLSPAPVELSRTFHSRQSCRIAVLQPPRSRNSAGLGSTPFARHYLGHHILFSLPPGTKMFQFPGFAPIPGMGDGPSARRVAPFGNPWVTGRLHLTTAYRSLPRPSSPSRAKASAVRPFLLSPRPCRQPCSRRHGTCLRPTEHHRADGPRILSLNQHFLLTRSLSSAPHASQECKTIADQQHTSAEKPFSSVPACQRPRRENTRTLWRITDSNR